MFTLQTGHMLLHSVWVVQISSDEIEKLYDYAKLQFDCGTYPEAAANLHFYRLLTQNAERSFSALWGKLACEIATGNWENANEDLFKLKDAIEAKVPPTTDEMGWAVIAADDQRSSMRAELHPCMEGGDLPAGDFPCLLAGQAEPD